MVSAALKLYNQTYNTDFVGDFKVFTLASAELAL